VLAAAPITWGVCELPEWGDVPPFDQVLDEMAAAGFAGTELGPPGFLPAEPGRLRQALDARGLALVGAFCPVMLHRAVETAASLESGVALARLLAALGCPLLVAADAGDARRRAVAGRVTPGAGLTDDEWARLGDGLADLARRCAPLGVRVVFHPHAGTYVETEVEVDRLMAAAPTDQVGLCLDTGHLAYSGADPVDVCRRYAARVWHVHAKDVRADVLARVRDERLDYATAVGLGVFAPLGDGALDFPALVGTLRDAGYRGWYVLEQDVRLGPPWPPQVPAANARRSAQYLRELLEPSSPSSHARGVGSEDSRGPAAGGPLCSRERGAWTAASLRSVPPFPRRRGAGGQVLKETER
jgi:inosose dehydratase